MKKELLTKPFPQSAVKQRKGRNGKMLSYVPAHLVVERLNAVADFEWNFEIVRHDILQDEVIVVGRLTINGVTKMAFGSSSITRNDQGKDLSVGDDAKAASSDCLKKAASLFGIGLELYGGAVQPERGDERHEPPTPRPEERLTARQLSTLESAARRRGWSPERFAGLLHQRFGKASLHALTRSEASSIISELSDSSLNGH